ncbi:nudix hydrolase 14 [Drepanopeziza brunnea f. sp. 'multigermtubi' MB_m1]|uniref:Nudix hydrolase 14 n=1 Tax=Marssonina brunnea f. sp. multigermtubi (strain MB_m1) TaxID=1072389 RepID=K1WVI6_MARBU|nr:nudix hydrolase 14 [Drepanopeziza brunnea f. sp. 'multigermtubi' MB_m1]EKD16492.1 nudix hydrolase 14 [Drepanopeziza brunnea f. sp. 'multigermtubi' MB_m1]
MPSFAPDASVAILAIVRPADRPLEHYIMVTYPQLAIPAGTLDPHLNIRLTAQEIHEDIGPIPRADELVDMSGLVDQKGGDETRFVLWDRVLDRSDIEDMKVTMAEEGAVVRLLDPHSFTEKAKRDSKSQAAWDSYQYLRKTHRDVLPEVRRYRRS